MTLNQVEIKPSMNVAGTLSVYEQIGGSTSRSQATKRDEAHPLQIWEFTLFVLINKNKRKKDSNFDYQRDMWGC